MLSALVFYRFQDPGDWEVILTVVWHTRPDLTIFLQAHHGDARQQAAWMCAQARFLTDWNRCGYVVDLEQAGGYWKPRTTIHHFPLIFPSCSFLYSVRA